MTLWQMIASDLEPLNFKDRLARRRLWTRSIHEQLAEERDEDGRVIREPVPPRRIPKGRTTTIRYPPFWDRLPEHELDEALLKLTKMSKGKR